MKNQVINRKATIKVAKALGELNEEVVFVGGAMVSLYMDDPAAEDIRPTKDLDLTFQITTVGKLEELRERLTKKGFSQSHEDNVVCRFRLDDLLIDVMSTQAIGWPQQTGGLCQALRKHMGMTWTKSKFNSCRCPIFWPQRWRHSLIGV